MFAIGVGDRRDGRAQRAADPGRLGHEELPGVLDRDGRLHARHRLQRSRGCTAGPRLQPLQCHRDGQEGDRRGEVRDAWVSKSAGGSAAGAEAPAWQFNYRWFKPDSRQPSVNSGTATQSGNTAAAGTIDFVWRPTSATALSNITISETPLPTGFEADSVTCTSAGTTILDSDVPAIVASFTLSGLKVRDHVDCVVRNQFKRSTVRVVKQWVGDPARRPSSSTPTAPRRTTPRPSRPRAERAPRSTTRSRPRARVGETTVPTGYRATIQCEGQGPPQVYTGGRVPGHVPGRGRRDRYVHDHQHPESLDRPGDQAVGRHARLGNDLRRPGRLVHVRRLDTSRPRAARAPPSRTRPRPRSRWARLRCRTDTAPRFSAARVPNSPMQAGPSRLRRRPFRM